MSGKKSFLVIWTINSKEAIKLKCLNCGNEIKEGANFCRECGSEVIQQTEVLEGNICPSCGNVLEEDAIFCNNCGCRVANEEAVANDNSNYCPNCNSLLRADALFCRECGTPLNGQQIPQRLNREPEKKKKDKGLIFLIILLIIVLIGSAGVIGYVYYQNNSENVEIPEINVKTKTEDKEEEEQEEQEEEEEEEEEEEQEEQTETDEEEELVEEMYLFPSDREYITESDLAGKTKEEVAMIRNEISARHGYIFSKEPFKTYFESQDWYVPNENFSDSLFSEIEKTNKDFLVEYEERRGWR